MVMWDFLKSLFGKVPKGARGPFAILTVLVVLGAGFSITTPTGTYSVSCTHAELPDLNPPPALATATPEEFAPAGIAPTVMVPLVEDPPVLDSVPPPLAGTSQPMEILVPAPMPAIRTTVTAPAMASMRFESDGEPRVAEPVIRIARFKSPARKAHELDLDRVQGMCK